jgi:hypothetical protein
MARRKFYKHLDILAIDLRPYVNLYGFAQFVDYRKLGIEIDSPECFYLFNHFSKTNKYEIEDLEHCDLITNPLPTFKINNTFKDVEIVGKEKFLYKKVVRQKFRTCHPFYKLGDIQNEELEWSFLSDSYDGEIALSEIPTKYNMVKHLEHHGEMNVLRLKDRLLIEYHKKFDLGFDIEKWKEVFHSDYVSKVFNNEIEEVDPNLIRMSQMYTVYLRCFDIPIFSTIPEEIRFKPKNFE